MPNEPDETLTDAYFHAYHKVRGVYDAVLDALMVNAVKSSASSKALTDACEHAVRRLREKRGEAAT